MGISTSPGEEGSSPTPYLTTCRPEWEDWVGGRATLNSILASLRIDPMADVIKVWQAPSTIHSFLGKLDYLQKNLGGSTHNP